MIGAVSFLGGLIGLVVGGHLVVDGAANSAGTRAAYVTFLVLDATGHQASNRFASVLAFVMSLTVITFAIICRRGLQNGRFKKGYSEADDY